MPSVVFIDGVETSPERATVSVFDRAFLYGDSVFETLRVHRGAVHLLADHVARLRASASATGIALALDDAALGDEIRSAVASSGEVDAVVRITISRGAGPVGIDPRSASAPRRIVSVEPLAARLASPVLPVAVRLVQANRGSALAPHAKIGAYVDAILALRVAHAEGDDDAVFVDHTGALLEGTTSNVFVVDREGALVTPPLGAIFPGLTRREVLRIAGPCGISSTEAAISASTLLEHAAEAFLTSSVREIVAIGRIDGELVGDGAEGPVTRRLREAYRASVLGGS